MRTGFHSCHDTPKETSIWYANPVIAGDSQELNVLLEAGSKLSVGRTSSIHHVTTRWPVTTCSLSLQFKLNNLITEKSTPYPGSNPFFSLQCSELKSKNLNSIFQSINPTKYKSQEPKESQIKNKKKELIAPEFWDKTAMLLNKSANSDLIANPVSNSQLLSLF